MDKFPYKLMLKNEDVDDGVRALNAAQPNVTSNDDGSW